MANKIWFRSFFVIVIVVTLLGLGDIASPQTTSCVIGTYDCTGNAPCVANYIRAGVGVCVRNSGTIPVDPVNGVTADIPIGTSCTAVNLTKFGLTSAAKSATLLISRSFASGTAAGPYSMEYLFYSDLGCTTLLAPNFTESYIGTSITNTLPLYPYWIGIYSTMTSPFQSIFGDNVYATVYLNGQTTIYGKIVYSNVPPSGQALLTVLGISAYYD